MPVFATALTVGATLYGANKQAKTAKQVANMEAETASENRKLAEEQYLRASRTLQPQVDRGEYAGSVLDTMYLGNMAPRRLYGSPNTGYAPQSQMPASQNAMAQNPNYLLPPVEQRVEGQVYRIPTNGDLAVYLGKGKGFKSVNAGGGGGSFGGRSNAV